MVPCGPVPHTFNQLLAAVRRAADAMENLMTHDVAPSEQPLSSSIPDPTATLPILESQVAAELPSLVELYKRIHANPELSGHEEKTAALVADELRALGFRVTEGIGKYDQYPWPGYGIVAVMENAAGPTVLVRADMDALPVEEKTGLPYASSVRGISRDGKEVAVMHACGHDVHVAVLLGTARVMARMKEKWQGNLVLVAQPGEEGGCGAKAMLNDGALQHCPEPNYALSLHTTLHLQAGAIGYVPGYFMASFTDVEIKVRGVGSHGSAAEFGKDPIVMAAQLILALQTIVSREKSPFEPAVVTVGSVHGGTASNIIPEEVVLQLSIRSYDDAVRERILTSIERIAAGVALTAGVPEDRAPQVRVKAAHPANYNDPGLTERLAQAARPVLGEENVVRANPVMASEDFGAWALDGRVPTCMFWLGGADPERFRESQESGVALPAHHSPLFAPLPEPTISTGVRAMAAAVLDLLAPLK
jgi:amidohydrolase